SPAARGRARGRRCRVHDPPGARPREGRAVLMASWLRTDDERWLPISGFEGSSEVSDHGRVRSLDRAQVIDGRWGPMTRNIKGRVLAPSAGRSGHLVVHRWLHNEKHVRKVHHLGLEAFVGPRGQGGECLHKDGDPANNQLANLVWG